MLREEFFVLRKLPSATGVISFSAPEGGDAMERCDDVSIVHYLENCKLWDCEDSVYGALFVLI
jgi:hypothetical protein